MPCECNIAAQFGLGSQGIFSANMRVNTNFSVTEGGIVLKGATMGDLSISAYTTAGKDYSCPGRAGASFEWLQKLSCEGTSGLEVYIIPNGRSKGFKEGDAPVTLKPFGCEYKTFSASAQSGPHTPVLQYTHTDGYDLRYSGGPISVSSANGQGPTSIGFLGSIIPYGDFYMTNFSYEHTPPNMPVVNYSFMFVYNCN